MNRAEMRRMKREQEKAHTVTYNLTQAQLDAIVQEKSGLRLPRLRKRFMKKLLILYWRWFSPCH